MDQEEIDALRNVFSFGKNGMLESYLQNISKSIYETGELPAAERGTLAAQCWAVLKQRGLADKAKFVAMVREVYEAGNSPSPDAWRDALNRHFGGASPQSAPVERLGQAASKFQQSAASSGGGGGQGPPKPPQSPFVVAGGNPGDDPLKRLADAAEKLSKAAEKLDRTADKLGKGEVGTTGGPGQKKEGDAGLAGWARNYLNHVGKNLGRFAEDKSVDTFGEGLGRPLGKFLKGRIGRGVKKVSRLLKRRKPLQPKKAPDLSTASAKAREAGGAAKSGSQAEAASGAAADAGAASRMGSAAEGVAGSATGSAATGEAAAGGAAAGAEAVGVEAAVGADAALAGTGVGAPVAVTILAVIACGEALKKFHDVVKKAAEAQQEHNFKLAEASAAMAMVQAEVDIRTTFRNQEIGDRTAGSAGDLSNAIQNLEDNTKEIQILFDRVVNTTLAAAVNVLDEIVKPINAMAQGINWLANNIPGMPGMPKKSDDRVPTFFEQMDQIRKAEEESRRHNDEWWHHADFGRQRRDERPG